jgi:hypothetical protein
MSSRARVSSTRCGGLDLNGLDAWAEVVERGYEGLVAKDEASAFLT